MPKYQKVIGIGEQVARLEAAVARLQRQAPARTLSSGLGATSLHGMVYEDTTTYTTYFETMAPACKQLSLGIMTLGDQVSTTNTGGSWQLLINSVVVASGTVLPTFSYQPAQAVIDLSAYSGLVHIEVQGRRTSGATTGGRYSTGGTVGIGVRWCNFLS